MAGGRFPNWLYRVNLARFLRIDTCQEPCYDRLMKNTKSRLKKRIQALEERRSDRLEQVLDQDQNLIRGYLGTRARVCGNPGCRCARGELHESKYLSAAVDGVTRQVHVPKRDEVEVARGVERYRRFQELRAEIAELGEEVLGLVKELGEALLKPYPEKDPIPPAKKRGRKPGRG